MKRFAIFICEDYYPAGGWRDFVGSEDSLSEATTKEFPEFKYGDRHVVDLTTGEIVFGD